MLLYQSDQKYLRRHLGNRCGPFLIYSHSDYKLEAHVFSGSYYQKWPFSPLLPKANWSLTLAPSYLLNAEAVFLYLKSRQFLGIYSLCIQIYIFYQILMDLQLRTLTLGDSRVHINIIHHSVRVKTSAKFLLLLDSLSPSSFRGLVSRFFFFFLVP